jgi:AmmeMemoRadiSam system protein A
MNLVELARKSVESYINEGKIISSPVDSPKEFSERKAGAFVTIEKEGQLRGCIGTYLPTRKNIIEEVINNAVAAATEDYRFDPVEKGELPYLSYVVYILNEPELTKNTKGLNPKKYGIIIKTAGCFPPKSALLLPDLDDVDTIDEQISIACKKGGINPEKEKITIYRFTVEKYGE